VLSGHFSREKPILIKEYGIKLNDMRPIGYAVLMAMTVWGVTANARLGETWQECLQRYGNCLRNKDGTVKVTSKIIPNGIQAEWDYENFHITIVWLGLEGQQGPADLVQFRNNKGPITDAQLSAILSANSGGKGWRRGIIPPCLQDLTSQIKDATLMQKVYREDGAVAEGIFFFMPNLTPMVTLKSPRLLIRPQNRSPNGDGME
jgi:hypothetical protein